MYGQSISHSDGYNKMVKSTVQHHLSTTSGKHSSSHIKDTKKSEAVQRQKSVDKGAFQKACSHTSKTSHEHSKPHKVQGALRSCGRWSEHRSSSGKVYFYNTISEVSQWEKPKEWDDGTAVDLKAKLKLPVQRSTSKSSSSRLPSTSKIVANSSSEFDKDYRHQQKDYCDRDYRSKPTTGDHDYKDMDYRNTSAVSKASDMKNTLRRSISTDKDYRSQNPPSADGNTLINHSSNNSIVKENYVPATGKFYDYSSWNTSSSNNESKTVNGLSVLKASESFQKVTDEGSDNLAASESKSMKLAATSEFVRKLSNVLTQAATTSNSIKSEENIKDASDSNVKVDAVANLADVGDELPAKRPRAEDETLKSLPEKEASCKDQADDQLFKCLEEFYPVFEPNTIAHVQNWPAEQNEKQCVRLCEDFHHFIADQMSEVSVELTMARSKVRRSEILSTLHEQRVLYIRQQIKDLEKTSTSAGPFT